MTISQMNFFQRMWYILCRYSGSLLNGAATTMIIAIVCTLLGCVIGFAVGLVQTTEPKKGSGKIKRAILKVVKWIMDAYVEVFRGTPMMLQAAFIYYGMAQLFGINLSMWSAAILIVSINTGAYMAETVRGGILSIDQGQTEGAKAIGMNHVQTMVRVILPQALRNIMPQIGNNLIINIASDHVNPKDNTLLSFHVHLFLQCHLLHKRCTEAQGSSSKESISYSFSILSSTLFTVFPSSSPLSPSTV